MNYNFNDNNFKQTEIYKSFINSNPTKGTLSIRAYSANQAIPIEGLNIIISTEYQNNTIKMYEGKTNNSGVIENISLPTPKLSNSNLTTPNTITYTVRAMQTDKIDESYKINMYENISVIQTINIGPQTLKVGVTTWQ